MSSSVVLFYVNLFIMRGSPFCFFESNRQIIRNTFGTLSKSQNMQNIEQA